MSRSLTAKEREALWHPSLFSHGRVLQRCPGSDGCRFSPKLAYRLLCSLLQEPVKCFMDPFCGTGLIPAVARCFFSHRITHIVASDIEASRVQAAHFNLAIWDDPTCQKRHLSTLQGRQGCNEKSAKRWQEVELYYRSLIDAFAMEPLASYSTLCAPIQQLPPSEEEIFFLSDAPYGKSCDLQGEPWLFSLKQRFPRGRGAFVLAEPPPFLLPSGMTLHPLKGGRVLLLWSLSPSLLFPS